MSERLPVALARQVGERGEISIRVASPADAPAIRRLAALLDRAAPSGGVLVAETDGSIVAALSTTTGVVVTDPFRATGDLVALLRLRSSQLHDLAA